MPSGKSPKGIKKGYADKLLAIKPFVNFNFKRPERLAPKTKGKITRLFNQIQKLQPGNRFIPIANKGNREKASLVFNQVKSYKNDIKGVWIPETQIGNGSLSFKNGNPFIDIDNFPRQSIFPLNQVHLAKNPRKALEALIADSPDDAIFVPLSKKDGEMINSTGYRNDKKNIIDTILDWMNQYEDVNIWLTGIKEIGTFKDVQITSAN